MGYVYPHSYHQTVCKRIVQPCGRHSTLTVATEVFCTVASELSRRSAQTNQVKALTTTSKSLYKCWWSVPKMRFTMPSSFARGGDGSADTNLRIFYLNRIYRNDRNHTLHAQKYRSNQHVAKVWGPWAMTIDGLWTNYFSKFR